MDVEENKEIEEIEEVFEAEIEEVISNQIEEAEEVPEKRKPSALELFNALKQSDSAMADGVSVYRFTTQRVDNAAPKKFLGFYEMTATLEQEIKDNHGGGFYFLQLRQNGSIATTTRLTISGKPFDDDTDDDDTDDDRPTIIQAPQQNGFNQLKDVLGIVREVQKLQIPIAQNPSESKSLIEQIKELKDAAETLGLSKSQTTGATMADVVLAGIDRLPDILANVVPAFAFAQNSDVPTVPNNLLQNNPTQSEKPKNAMQLFQVLIGQLIEQIQQNKEVQEGVDLCKKFYAENPAVQPLVDGFMSLSPAMLVTALKANPATRELAALPQATEYLHKLFSEYKKQKEG